MSAKDDGGPIASGMEVYSQGESQRLFAVGGLTMRDWFAGMAMQGYLAGRSNIKAENPMNFERHRAAKDCYNYADAMLAARKERS